VEEAGRLFLLFRLFPRLFRLLSRLPFPLLRLLLRLLLLLLLHARRWLSSTRLIGTPLDRGDRSGPAM